MATDTREPLATPTVAMGLAEADAKMVVATGHGDCQKLKDLVQEQDPTTMLVVMASGKQTSPKKPSGASMHPLVAAAACRGNLQELRILLNREPSEDLSQEFLHQKTAYFCTTNTSDVEQQVQPLPLNDVTVEGDTVLHLVAANGEGHNFLACANFIHGLEEGLLCNENNSGDTPLHCAARAGKAKMVCHLIALATGSRMVTQLLRKVNKRKETALHEAVRIGDNQLVVELLRTDRELACFPKEGTSPLYLAISLGRDKTAMTLHDESENKILSYLGPDGQNALHAAVLRGPELTRMVLEWNTNNDLTTQRDKNGSTPLHFAAGLVPPPWERRMLTPSRRGSVVFSEKLASKILKRNVFAQVLEANTAAVYQPDNAGLYPIHVAASVGAEHAIALIVEKYGGTTTSAGLRDTKGRTFLHVAVEEKQVGIVCYACGNRSLEWIMNMQDSDGNTALHLAVKAGSLRVFSALFGNKHVSLNLANMKEETPLDIAAYSMAPGVHYGPDSEVRIFQALLEARAMRGTSRQDHLKENYKKIHGRQIEYEKKDMEKLKDSTQTVCIGSVLIATVTFGSTFALPGGYRADDHTNGGTPTLAGRYAFDAFVIANTLAFVLSSLATFLLLRSGIPYINIRSRRLYIIIAFNLVDDSVTCLVAAFALAVYVVLGSVARNTAIAAGVLSLLVVICTNADAWLKSAILARPLFFRRGGPRLSLLFHYSVALVVMFHACWPFLVIFLWATYGRNHHPIAMSGSPAPAPPPLG